MVYTKAWEMFFINLYKHFINIIVSLNNDLKSLMPYANIFIFVIIGLSALLFVYNLLWRKYDDYMNVFHISVMILTTLISIVEIVFLLFYYQETKWFFDISEIGFGLFLLNFVIFMFILVNQAYAYYQLSMQLPNYSGQDELIRVTMGIYPLFILSGLFLKNYVPGLGIGLALVVIMQLGFSMMIFQACNYDNKGYLGLIYTLIFIVWSLALNAMLSYFLIYLVAALIIGFAIAFGLFLLFDMANQKFTFVKLPDSPKTEYVKCEICGAMLPKESPYCNCQYRTWK